MRNLIGSCGLLVAIGLASQPAQAGDWKSGSPVHQAEKEIRVSWQTHAVSPRFQIADAAVTRSFETGHPASDDSGSGREKGKAIGVPTKEHRALTLFHLNSRFGDIAVQPVIGHVNGAQFSLGF
jgi:hypothetical protein